MPLGDFERTVLRLIAANRHPDSYVAGATVLHQLPDSPRSSRDVDLFHDTEESLTRSVELDSATLRQAGFTVEMGNPQPSFQRAVIGQAGRHTKVEWAFDSAFRFFPVESDPELGWRLNFWDDATNQVLARFSRQGFRDFVDTLYLRQHHWHLGALVWAAAGKDPGLTPELIVDWIKRHTFYSPEQVKQVQLVQPLDWVKTKRDWLQIMAATEALIATLPVNEMGCFYLNKTGQPVCPDSTGSEFAKLTRHFGCLRGALPRIIDE